MRVMPSPCGIAFGPRHPPAGRALAVSAALAAAAAACAADFTWSIKYSGGSDANAGTSWTTAWATLQKAWDQIDATMGGNNEPSNNTDVVYLERTTGAEAFAGANSPVDWWGYFNDAGSKAARIYLFGGYDPVSDTRTGTTSVTNKSGRTDVLHADLFSAHPEYLTLYLHDLVMNTPETAVRLVDMRDPRLYISRCSFHSRGSSGAVVDVDGNPTSSAILNRTLVRGGSVGILLDSGGYWHATASLTNCAVTDAAAAAIRIRQNANHAGVASSLTLHNVTLSNIGDGSGTAVHLIYEGAFDYDSDFGITLRRTAIANVGTNVVYDRPTGKTQNLQLNGSGNAFYDYAVFHALTGDGGGIVVNNLTASDDRPAADSPMEADGYHLRRKGPLVNAYTLGIGDPAVDIEGNPRPLPAGRKADIGCDEAMPVLGTVITLR